MVPEANGVFGNPFQRVRIDFGQFLPLELILEEVKFFYFLS